MPLLKKRVFEKASPPEFLRDDEEVFFCEVTNEIFRNYEEFAERMLLCTSMVWTCAMTGRSNLTYEEALDSEQNAKRSISEFPVELRIPVLYVASKTKRTGFKEMAEDVFLYCKDRYFIGEKVESCFTADKWVESHVLHVIAPSEDEIKKISPPNGSNDKHIAPPPEMFKYEIEHLDADDADISEIMILNHNQLRRRKVHFSRDKCKLFLKQYVQQDTNSHWIIKPSAMKELGIDRMKFNKIFSGPEPAFDSSRKYDKNTDIAVNGKKSRQETLGKYLTKLNGPANMNGTANKKNKDSEAKSTQFMEEMERRKEEFQRKKQQKEEEQKLVAAQLKKWKQPKEDLELEDQLPLPELPALVCSNLPEKYIGDVLMIMEFIKIFETSINPKKFVQGKITLELMERALSEKEVAGPLIDLIQMFLCAILREQDEERQDYSIIPTKATFLRDIDVNNMSIEEVARFATLAAHWPKKSQGMYLRELPMYSLTVSELLRLHLLSSGSKLQESAEKKRYYLRGGYSSSDDPGLHLRMNKPHILRALAVKNVAQLRLKDKIEILSCLVHQLLTYPNYRDPVEDRRENDLQVRTKMKVLERENRKRENEFNSSMSHLKKKAKKDPTLEKEMDDLKKAEEKRKSQHDVENRRSACEGGPFLGMDRAFRKYYKLESLGGILIDSTEDNPGKCLSEIIKQVPELAKADEATIQKYLEKKIQSLKINNVQEDSEKKTPMTNGIKEDSGKDSESTSMNGTAENGHDNLLSSNNLLICSGNEETCDVHSDKREQCKWKVISQTDSLDQLMSNLNRRGIREGELLQLLNVMGKEWLQDYVEKTPIHLWSKEEDSDTLLGNRKKGYVEANFGFPAGTPVDEILQNTLTDEILELDDKIYTGSLGQFRGKNREEWRNALLTKDYKNFNREINRRVFVEKDENVVKEEDDDVVAEVKGKFSTQDPGTFLGPSSACDSDSESEGKELNQSSDVKDAVQCLAIALAQVAYSVEPRFLRKPLGDSDHRKISTYVPSANQLKKWEDSLLLSTSFSQIFLHYSTLDASIMWSRSTRQVGCKVCRKKVDSENMLLCDNCNRGFHLYCLKPKMKNIPNGDWFCEDCDKARSKDQRVVSSEVLPTKKRRVFKEEEDVSEQEELQDHEVTSVPVKVELCAACNSGGRLMVCGNCEMSYHKECVNPPLTRVKIDWVCEKCRENIQEDREELKGQNNNRRSRRSDKDSRKFEELDDSDSGDSSKNLSKRKRSFRKECSRDDLPLHNAALQDLLQEIMKHTDAWPFLRPVKNHEVPDYHDLITHPMDFGTIKYKLNMGEYQTDSQMMNDAALVFQNCNTYNEANSEIHRCGMKVLKCFRNKCEELGLEIPSKLAEEEVQDKKRRRKLY